MFTDLKTSNLLSVFSVRTQEVAVETVPSGVRVTRHCFWTHCYQFFFFFFFSNANLISAFTLNGGRNLTDRCLITWTFSRHNKKMCCYSSLDELLQRSRYNEWKPPSVFDAGSRSCSAYNREIQRPACGHWGGNDSISLMWLNLNSAVTSWINFTFLLTESHK